MLHNDQLVKESTAVVALKSFSLFRQQNQQNLGNRYLLEYIS